MNWLTGNYLKGQIKKKRNELSLMQKVNLPKNTEGRRSRQLAEMYGNGQVS